MTLNSLFGELSSNVGLKQIVSAFQSCLRVFNTLKKVAGTCEIKLKKALSSVFV